MPTWFVGCISPLSLIHIYEEFIYYGVIHHAGVQAQRIQWHNQMGANSANNTYPVGSWDVSCLLYTSRCV